MAENELIVTAGLNFEASEALIVAQLKKIQKDFNSEGGLKIDCTVNDAALKQIQANLANISKNLTIGLDTSAVDKNIVQTANTVQRVIGTATNIKLHIDSKPINDFIERLQDVGVGGKTIDQLTKKLEALNIVVTKIVPQFTQLKGGEQQLTSFSITGLDKAGNTVEYLEKFNAETGDFEKASTKVVSNLARIQQENKKVEDSARAAQLAYNDFLKLKGQADLYSKKFSGDESLKSQLSDIQKLVAEFDNTQPVEKQRESIIKIDNALKLVKADIDAISKASSSASTLVEKLYPNISFNKGDSTASILSNAKNQLNTYLGAENIEGEASRVKRAVEDTSGSLQRFYVQVERGDKSVETLTYALNEQGTAYEYLGKVIREADNSTDFRRKDIATQWEIQTEKLEQFATKAEKAGSVSNVLAEDISRLRARINEGGDTSAMNAFLDDFDIAKAKFQSLNAEAKVVEASIKKLNQVFNNTQFNNNQNNPAVVQQRTEIEGLRAEYEKLLTELSQAKDPQSLMAINNRLAELKPKFDSVVQSSEALNQSLKSDDASAKLSAKIKNLTNQMDGFANTNRRVIESLRTMRNGTSFASEWERMMNQLKSGNLDENGIRRLTEDFRNFKGEANAAGMTVNKFFQNMNSQIRMVIQRWISLYAVVGRITTALNDLKNVDKILTEIAKSSDVTRESLQALGDSAFEMANKYGRAASDYLYGVQEFSRAGFRGEQLTDLTQVSLLAQAAGDIETDLANSYVIATNAAYGLAGSQEKLGEVLDRQNYVTNNYALNMTDLASATKIAASQAAQSGVEIDQMTAALATMISTTQQGGEIAARSLRGILMNIQQVKGEVGDGEEDITAESLSKYEKAAQALGVALKETKNGVTVLREPMAVLNDLAEAFNKEADDSIKKANLINAIGGKIYLVA